MTRPGPVLYFEVLGDPRSQGSKEVQQRKDGRVWMREYKADELKEWRSLLSLRAREAKHQAGLHEPLEVAVVAVEFIFPRPKNHWRTHHGRPTGELLDWAQRRIYKRGPRDVDKLQRAVGDALEAAQIVRNDGGIVAWAGPPECWEGPRKVYGDHLGARIWIYNAEEIEALRAGAGAGDSVLAETKSPVVPVQEELIAAGG